MSASVGPVGAVMLAFVVVFGVREEERWVERSTSSGSAWVVGCDCSCCARRGGSV